MSKLKWDETGKRTYEVGVSQGVLYIPNAQGEYATGVAWNGLTTVTESPSGAETTKHYADNIPYLSLTSAEEFSATIEAFTWPDEFELVDGLAQPEVGVSIGQQPRKVFGFAYRTKVGNDIDAENHGYKLHLIYGCKAAPSEKAYATISDSTEPTTFSWELTTDPVAVGTIGSVDYKPTSIITIDSTKVAPADLTALETLLYGSATVEPALPLPAAVIALFST